MSECEINNLGLDLYYMRVKRAYNINSPNVFLFYFIGNANGEDGLKGPQALH